MRKLIAVLAVAAGLVAFPAAAVAGDHPPSPQTPCANGNPTDLCGPTVEVATPQECPNGGIVIVSGDVRWKVCAGTNGTNGVNGTNGTNGASGADGTNGATGTNGVAGTNGAAGAPAPVVPPVRPCTSRRQITYTAPAPYERGDRVRMIYDNRVVTSRVTRNGKIKVDFRGLRCGVYSVVIRARGEEPFLRLQTLGPNGSLTGFNTWVSLSALQSKH